MTKGNHQKKQCRPYCNQVNSIILLNLLEFLSLCWFDHINWNLIYLPEMDNMGKRTGRIITSMGWVYSGTKIRVGFSGGDVNFLTETITWQTEWSWLRSLELVYIGAVSDMTMRKFPHPVKLSPYFSSPVNAEFHFGRLCYIHSGRRLWFFF
jgi:hypothetical protein